MPFLQADLFNWARGIDHIDGFLDRALRLNPELTEGVHISLCLACLRFSKLLLSNSWNKQLYNSIEVYFAFCFLNLLLINILFFILIFIFDVFFSARD